MEQAVAFGFDRDAGDPAQDLCLSFADAIARLGTAIRALEYVHSALHLHDLREECGVIREISLRLGLESPVQLAGTLDRFAASLQEEGQTLSDSDRKALTDGYFCLAARMGERG